MSEFVLLQRTVTEQTRQNWLTNCAGERHSRKANSSSASHDIPRTVWKPEDSLQLLQDTVTCSCPWPDQSIPRTLWKPEDSLRLLQENATCLGQINPSHAPYGNPKIHCSFYKRKCYLPLSWARSIHSTHFMETQRFITAFTRDCHLLLSWARSIHSTHFQPIYWRSVLILSCHLRALILPSGLLPSCFPNTTLNTPLISPIRAICLAHLILLYSTTRIIFGEKHKSGGSWLCLLWGTNTLRANKVKISLSFQMSHPRPVVSDHKYR